MDRTPVHGRLGRVRRARRELAEKGPSHTRAEGDFERVSLPAREGDLLRDLLLADEAGTVIEIGLAYGSSALAIGEALAHHVTARARHVAIDPWQAEAFRDAGRRAIRAAGLDDICTLIPERSQLALPRLLGEGFVADAAFVDGSHHFHDVFVDLYYLGRIVRPGGLVILDDGDWPSVATAVRYFEGNQAWRRLAVSVTDGDERDAARLRAYRLPDPAAEPSFDDFRPFA